MREARKAGREADAEARSAARDERARAKSVNQRLRERDQELRDRTRKSRERRAAATDVYNAVGFERMFRNGLCEVEEGLFSETLRFSDVSYQSAREDDQRAIFEAMAQLNDYFDSSTMVQYLVTNTPLTAEEIGRRAFFDASGENAELASEYNAILNEKVREGSSNIRREHYITYAVEAENADRARQLLAGVRAGVRGQLEASVIKSRTHLLDGAERLGLVSSILRPGIPFSFDYERDLSIRSPLTSKDFVCPTSLDFRPAGGDSTCYRSDGTWCQVLVMRESFASELTDRSISSLLDLQVPMAVSWHLQPVDKAKAVAMAKRQNAWIQKDIIENQQRAVKQGYDYTIIPPELEQIQGENRDVIDQLLHRNQRLYLFTGLVWTCAADRKALDAQVVDLIRAARQQGIELTPLALRQREGMNSVLPLAHNHVDVQRDFTTKEATMLVPFTTQELDQEGGGYYGQNKLSQNLVICNRKSLMSPHGFICGMTRSGKSFLVKKEQTNTVLAYPGDEIYICDITGEYAFLVNSLHGTRYRFGPRSDTFVNPFELDLTSDQSFSEGVVGKIDAFLAMVSALKAEGGQPLSQEERSIISAVVDATYRSLLGSDMSGRQPVLGDFAAALEAYEGVGANEARRLALVLGRYVTGPLSFMNHQSSVAFGKSRLVSFDTADVPNDMRVFTMLGNLEAVRQRMFVNHQRGVRTWLYIDEIQALFAHPSILAYLARLWREGAKYGLICTGMTQSAEAMAGDGDAKTILDQSGFFLLLRQSDADRAFWAATKGLSAQEVGYIGETGRPGEGLLIADGARVPIFDEFPRGNGLYTMFSTSPEDYAAQRAAMEAVERAGAQAQAGDAGPTQQPAPAQPPTPTPAPRSPGSAFDAYADEIAELLLKAGGEAPTARELRDMLAAAHPEAELPSARSLSRWLARRRTE